MARLIATRSAQTPLFAEFVFNFNDTAVDAVSGAVKGFGTTIAENLVFDAIPLPVGAVITGGALIVETAGVGPTAYTVSVGSAASATDLLAATSILATGRTALTGLGIGHVNGANVRITLASTVAAATAGKVRVRVEYTIDGRSVEMIGT